VNEQNIAVGTQALMSATGSGNDNNYTLSLSLSVSVLTAVLRANLG